MMAYKERLHTKEVLLKSQVHPVRVGVSRELTYLPGGGGGNLGYIGMCHGIGYGF